MYPQRVVTPAVSLCRVELSEAYLSVKPPNRQGHSDTFFASEELTIYVNLKYWVYAFRF